MEIDISGNLKNFNVSAVFSLLAAEKKTGALTLKHKRSRFLITFQEGAILDVEDSDNSKDARMQSILLKSGKVSEIDFNNALEERRVLLATLGTVLRDRGLISSSDQQRLARLVFLDILFEAKALKDGTYAFEVKEEVIAGEMEHPFPVTNLLVIAAQQEDEWKLIKRSIPNMKIVFVPISGPDTDSWNEVLASLNEADRAVAKLIDGYNSVKLIAARTLSSDFEVAKLMADLCGKRLISHRAKQQRRHVTTKLRTFVSAKLGKEGIILLTIVLVILSSAVVYRNYIIPVINGPEAVVAPLKYGGMSASTVDKLRLLRIKLAFQLYLNQHGKPPSSLATLAVGGYCLKTDLFSVYGGPFVVKILGDQEEYAIIHASDMWGRSLPDLTVEISLR